MIHMPKLNVSIILYFLLLPTDFLDTRQDKLWIKQPVSKKVPTVDFPKIDPPPWSGWVKSGKYIFQIRKQALIKLVLKNIL